LEWESIYRENNSSGQKPLDLPQTLAQDLFNIAKYLVLFFCRRIIFAPANFKIVVYFLIILIGSFIKEFELAPQTYLSGKRNIFNSYFAKLGWGWTMGLLIPFVYLTSLIYTKGNYRLICRHLIRLLVATGVWYVVTKSFLYFEAMTGQCTHDELEKAPKHICLQKGKEFWQDGYDLSGHVFLLMYSLLVINEEVTTYDDGWTKFEKLQKQVDTKKMPGTGDATSTTFDAADAARLRRLATPIRCFYVVLAALTVLWEFMLLSTALYFHHTSHKLGAAGVATLFWYLTYHKWYKQPSKSIFSPCLPGDGVFFY